MYRDDYHNSGTSLLSFLAGTVIGAGIALLYAPKTGKETREILVDYGQELKDKSANLPMNACQSADGLVDRGRNLIDRGKDLIEQGTDMVTSGKEYLDEKKQALSDAIEAGKDAMEREKEDLASSLSSDE
ncbi:MAG: YtxH domain-containing protein [Desulfobulbaceae bacterium]|jgi:gas vesicle protein|nr:YtxH domain-containing protein [Desulfobulbaceae bacterium]